MVRTALLLAASLATAAALPAQEVPPAEASPPPPPAGRFRLGPVYVTPTLRIGTLGLDTNVFYTPADRQTDFIASAGPGLDVHVPIRRAASASVTSHLDYLYFARTASLRKLMGGAVGEGRWRGARTEILVEEALGRTFGRPSLEVDRRVVQDREGTRGTLRRRLFGRFRLRAESWRTTTEVPDGEEFRGIDLRNSLSRDTLGVRAGLEYALTVKTSLVARGDAESHAFPYDGARDGSFRTWRAGIETDPSALVSGHLLAGVGEFRSDESRRRYAVLDLDATYNHSPRTRFGVLYQRSRGYSALGPAASPTLLTRAFGLTLEKEILGTRLDLRLFGRITRFTTDGAVTLTGATGGRVLAVRDDTAREAGADLGYRVRPRLRAGLVATYTERSSSSFADLGIDGLLVGAAVTYTP